jgi:hypothetical protein
MWMELRDQSIRTEADAEAALELPLLVAIPWVGGDAAKNANQGLKFWNRKNADDHKPQHKLPVGV